MGDSPLNVVSNCNSEQSELITSCKENGLGNEPIPVTDISVGPINNEVLDQKPIKMCISPFVQNNIISHELQETDIYDNSSMEPYDYDRENRNNNSLIKPTCHINSETGEKNINKEISEKHSNSDGQMIDSDDRLNSLNSSTNILTEIEKNLLNENENYNNATCSDNSVELPPSATSSSGTKLKMDSITCKLDLNKVKDDKRVPNHKCLDTDSEEDSSVEEYDNCAYNTEIQDVLLQVPKSPITNFDISRRSSLKRKLEDEDVNGKAKKRRKNIQFDDVTVFYFPRSQGFNCIPSQGGSTLGMSRKHFCIKRFSLTEHAAEQKRTHKEQILQSRLQSIASKKAACSSSEESEDTSDISDSEMEAEAFLFLQPLPIRQRRSLLRQAGIRQIEVLEKEECKDIRGSREMCGCQCKVTCYPETCQCAEAGIKCQVDRHNFPCGCTREGCGNESGRIEFNPIRVRTHFLQTLMRMEIEKRHSQWQNVDRKKISPSWFMSGPANSYIQSLNSNSALPSETSCSQIADPSNVCVSFDLNQHENKSAMRHYQGTGGDYSSTNGCYMFCGNVSPFDSVSSFSPSYCATRSTFPSSANGGFCQSCNSYSLSKLSSTCLSSQFASSPTFPYANGTFAAAVAVVSPSIGCGDDGGGAKTNGGGSGGSQCLPLAPGGESAFSSKATLTMCDVDDSAEKSIIARNVTHAMSYNGGPSIVQKHNNFLLAGMLSDDKREACASSPYSKLSSSLEACCSSAEMPVSSLTTTAAPPPHHQLSSSFKSPLAYFDEYRLNSSCCCSSSTSPHPHHGGYLNVVNSCLDVSASSKTAAPSCVSSPLTNAARIFDLRHSFISEKEESSSEFYHQGGFSACANTSSVVPAAAVLRLDEEEKSKIIPVPKVEDLFSPISSSSCSKPLFNEVPSVCQPPSHSNEMAAVSTVSISVETDLSSISVREHKSAETTE